MHKKRFYVANPKWYSLMVTWVLNEFKNFRKNDYKTEFIIKCEKDLFVRTKALIHSFHLCTMYTNEWKMTTLHQMKIKRFKKSIAEDFISICSHVLIVVYNLRTINPKYWSFTKLNHIIDWRHSEFNNDHGITSSNKNLFRNIQCNLWPRNWPISSDVETIYVYESLFCFDEKKQKKSHFDFLLKYARVKDI